MIIKRSFFSFPLRIYFLDLSKITFNLQQYEIYWFSFAYHESNRKSNEGFFLDLRFRKKIHSSLYTHF